MGGVWEAKILDFRAFFDVFSKSFLKRAREEPKIDPRGPTRRRIRKFSDGFRWSPPPPGERKREGIKSLGLHNELGLSDSPSVIEFDV